MTEILKPNNGIIFMKVGIHAQESLESIIERKSREIEEAGFALWGYGGNTCHPTTMVQPFAQEFTQNGSKILLCMQKMNSKHFADPVRAEKYSIDGLQWADIPAPINVLGSRYALAIKSLRQESFTLPLDQTAVAIGNSAGRAGNRYIAGRVDKACLKLTGNEGAIPLQENPIIEISLVAELCEPFAVFLKN